MYREERMSFSVYGSLKVDDEEKVRNLKEVGEEEFWGCMKVCDEFALQLLYRLQSLKAV